jgi:uroporphyrin-III C-methyltransferase
MTEQTEQEEAKPKGRKKSWTMFGVILAVVVIGVAVLWKYYWPAFQKEMLALKARPDMASAATIVNLQKSLAQKQNIIQELQGEIQKCEVVQPVVNWQPIIIEHFVRMADLILNTTKDVKAALAFLLAAKEYANTPETVAIGHALNKDIANLQAVPVVDVEGLLLKIDIVEKQIDALPITPFQAVIPAEPPTTAAAEATCLVKRLFASVVHALKGVVLIRHRAVEPILPPEQMTILRFNIQARLLEAKLAVMQKQNKLYQAYLAQITDLISKYFVLSNVATTSVLQLLQGLQQVNLQPELPVLTGSFTAIQNVTRANNVGNRAPEQSVSPPQYQEAKLL